MRRLLTQIEQLAPASFILVVGMAGGALRGIPPFFLPTTDGTGAHVAQFVVVALASALWWAAAILLCWTSARRRGFSTWTTAWHVTLGLALADVLGLALGYAFASIISHGAFVDALLHAPSSAALSNLGLILIRSPVRFLGAAMLIALGRQLPGTGSPVVPRPLAATDPEATT